MSDAPKTKSTKKSNNSAGPNVTRSVVFNRATLKTGVKAAKAQGRSFSNFLNQMLRETLAPSTSGEGTK